MDKYRVISIESPLLYQEIISSGVPTVCPNGETICERKTIKLEKDIRFNDGSFKEVTIEDAKFLRLNEIDRKTEAIIQTGYSFAGKQFSLSINGQTNILALDNSKDDPAITYPIGFNTIDDSETFMIPDSATLHGMYLTALGTKKAYLNSGTDLKTLINACSTVEEVDSIIDNR